MNPKIADGEGLESATFFDVDRLHEKKKQNFSRYDVDTLAILVIIAAPQHSDYENYYGNDYSNERHFARRYLRARTRSSYQ